MSDELASYKRTWLLANAASRPIIQLGLGESNISSPCGKPGYPVMGYNLAAEELLPLPSRPQSPTEAVAQGLLCSTIFQCVPDCPIEALQRTGKLQQRIERTPDGKKFFVEVGQIEGIDGDPPTALMVLQSGHESAMRNLSRLLLESTLDIKTILDVILDSMGEIPNKASTIMLTQDHVAQVVRNKGWGDMEGFVSSLQIPLDSPHFKHMVESGKPLIINDVRNQKGWAPTPELDPLGIVNHLSGPIMGRPDAEGKRKCHGFLFLGSTEAGHFTPRHAEKLQDMLEIIGPAFDNARIHSEIKKLSVRDGLTGLFNRRYMEEFLTLQIANATRNSEPLSAIMIDLDDFKKFNDRYGHLAGDYVLREFAVMLNTCIRDGDVACRYGGEEFTLILPKATREEAVMIAKRLQNKLKEAQLMFQTAPLRITISMGIADFPEQAQDEASLIGEADQALYDAKIEKNRIMVFGTNTPV